MEIKKYFISICLCVIFIENASAGISPKNTTEFHQKLQKKPPKFIITQRQLSQGADFIGRTWNSLVGSLDSSFDFFSSKNISSSFTKPTLPTLPSLTNKNFTLPSISITNKNFSLPSIDKTSLFSSFTTSGITNGFGEQVAKIPLFIGLPILIVGVALLTKAIAFIVAILPSYTAPIYNKLVEEYGEYFQFDDDKDSDSSSDGYGWQSQSPSNSYGAPQGNSYGAPQGDSYSNSRVTYVQTPQQPPYAYRPGPSRQQINSATQQLSQAVNKYSQI